MPVARIDEILMMLQSFALGELNVSKDRIKVAIKLIDLMLDDELPPDAPDEAPVLGDGDDQAVLIFPSRIAA
jgi:hypothetical protein